MEIAQISEGDRTATLSVMEVKRLRIHPGKDQQELLEKLGPGWAFVGSWRDAVMGKTISMYRRKGVARCCV
jgi:hypothetical protein